MVIPSKDGAVLEYTELDAGKNDRAIITSDPRTIKITPRMYTIVITVGVISSSKLMNL